MIVRIIKFVYSSLRKLLRFQKHNANKLFNFLLPNLQFLISRRVSYVNIPNCNQKTILSGLGNIQIGLNCSFGYKLGGFFRGGSIEIQPRYKDSKILFGNYVVSNNNVFFCAANHIEIGDNTLIGQNVIVMDHEAHNINPARRKEIGTIGKVVIGKNVWLGNNVTILKNSEIGDNSIVATGAVVSGKFPQNVIIGGVPAKIIKPIE